MKFGPSCAEFIMAPSWRAAMTSYLLDLPSWKKKINYITLIIFAFERTISENTEKLGVCPMVSIIVTDNIPANLFMKLIILYESSFY